MKRPPPADRVRCVALARWTGNGRGRCRNAAYGRDRFCKSHQKFPPRPEREPSILLEPLSVVHLGEGKEIVVELREREGKEFVSIRLVIGGAPTRRTLYLSPCQLEEFADGIGRAAMWLSEVRP